MIIDYATAKECQNYNALYVCLKCGECGRKFNKCGIMVDDGGTTVEEET